MVALSQKYNDSGPCVVSHRNIHHIGYNGIEFRKDAAYPELSRMNDPKVRQAWPRGILVSGQYDANECERERMYGSESVKCSPENWVVRRPVSHFNSGENTQARYPPKNIA